MNPNNAVKSIMTNNVISIQTDTPFKDIKTIFQQNNFHHLPVIKSGQVTGIISKENWLNATRNIARETTGNTWTEKQYQALTAQDIMTPNPVVLDPDDTIGLAADIFMANRFHALPIVEGGLIQGIVTTHDVLKYAFSNALAD